MSRRRPRREIFACPHCGADVPIGAKVCKECGSDAETGWHDEEEIQYQSLDLPTGYSDDPDHPGTTQENRCYSQLAWMLRAMTLVDVDSWSRVPGVPLPPGVIEREIRRRLHMAAKATYAEAAQQENT